MVAWDDLLDMKWVATVAALTGRLVASNSSVSMVVFMACMCGSMEHNVLLLHLRMLTFSQRSQ